MCKLLILFTIDGSLHMAHNVESFPLQNQQHHIRQALNDQFHVRVHLLPAAQLLPQLFDSIQPAKQHARTDACEHGLCEAPCSLGQVQDLTWMA